MYENNDVKNYGNKVFVSRYGEVFDRHLNKLVPELDKDKRAYVQINNVGFELLYIETLVARMFVKHEGQNRTPYLIHLDGDLQNNNADNLKWVDADEFAQYIAFDNAEDVQSNEDIIEYNDQLETKYNELVKKYINMSKTFEQYEEENKKLKTELKDLRIENANQLADIGNYNITVMEQAKKLEKYEQYIASIGTSSDRKQPKIPNSIQKQLANSAKQISVVQQKKPKRIGTTSEYDLVDEPKEIKYSRATYFITPNGNIQNKYRGRIDMINIDDKNICSQTKRAILTSAFFTKNKKRNQYSKVNYLLNLSVVNLVAMTGNNGLDRGYAVYRPVNATKSNAITYTLMKNGLVVYSTNIYAELVANLKINIPVHNKAYLVNSYWISQHRNIDDASDIWYIRITMPDGTIITKCPEQCFDKWEVSQLTDDYVVSSIKDCVSAFKSINANTGRDLINTDLILEYLDKYMVHEKESIKEIPNQIKYSDPIKIKDSDELLNNFRSSNFLNTIKLDIIEGISNAEIIHARKIRNNNIPERFKACRNGHILDTLACKYLTEYIKKNDYYVFVEIGGKEYRVDKLIAEAYYNGKDRADKIKNWVVIHTNKNLMDNRRDNLEYKPKEEANRYLPDFQKIKA